MLAMVEKKNTNVIHILNFLEEIATCHRLGICEDETLKDQFDAVVVATWRRLQPCINRHRSQRNSDDLWEDLETLYDSWKK